MAGGIPQAFIDEVLARTDIAELVNGYVPLTRKGSEFAACCPFHNEKTPSFFVVPAKQIFHCFGCGAGGSAFNFVMRHQNLSFPEAVEMLAGRLGLEVPRGRGGGPEDGLRKKLLAVLGKAAAFYHEQLLHAPQALACLEERGLDRQTMEDFLLGYAPPAPDALRKCFGADYDRGLLAKAGLLRADGGRAYLRGRIVFPIRNRQGKTIAFGGRVIDPNAQPKYLNSPETQVFQKRHALYGLHEIKAAGRIDALLLVEGYMDVVSLARHGVRNALATLGTAVTREHIIAAQRLCKKLVFCFDGDAAGQKAARTAMERSLPLLGEDREARFAFMPPGEDPDSLVRQSGADGLRAATDAALPLSQFMFGQLADGLQLDLPEGRAEFAHRARGLLDQLPQGAFADLLRAELAERAGVEKAHLEPQAATPPPPRAARRGGGGGARLQRTDVAVAVALLLQNPALAEHALAPERLAALERRGIPLLIDMLGRIREHDIRHSASLLEHYRETEHEQPLQRLLSWEFPPDDGARDEFRGVMAKFDRQLREREEKQAVLERLKGAQPASR